MVRDMAVVVIIAGKYDSRVDRLEQELGSCLIDLVLEVLYRCTALVNITVDCDVVVQDLLPRPSCRPCLCSRSGPQGVPSGRNRGICDSKSRGSFLPDFLNPCKNSITPPLVGRKPCVAIFSPA